MNAYEALLKELEKSNLRFSVALKMARICIFEVDLTRQLYTFFENSEAIFGVTGEKNSAGCPAIQPAEPGRISKGRQPVFFPSR